MRASLPADHDVGIRCGDQVQSGLSRGWLPKITARRYDSNNRPAQDKPGVTIGMGMTEKQGGTDVRANRSVADKVSEGIYRLNGHKWFMSAPMSDAFVDAGADTRGHRLLPGAAPARGWRRQRAAIPAAQGQDRQPLECLERGGISDTYGFLLGDPEHGIRTILEMVTLTRLDCALASAGIMRAALAEAVHHIRGRVGVSARN